MKRLIVGLTMLGLAACATAPATGGASLPPALQRVLDDYAAAWELHDAKGIAALFANDRVVVPNACPPIIGRTEVERCYARHGGGPLHLSARDHRIAGDLAYIIGEYALAEDEKPVGKFVLTLAAIDGRWLIAADMDRSYNPPPPHVHP